MERRLMAAEAELESLLRQVDRWTRPGTSEAEAMASDTRFCDACGTGVMTKRGSKYVCRACGHKVAAGSATPSGAGEPKGGHTSNPRGSTWDTHTKDHSSRTGQKKQLRQNKRQKEAEAELEAVLAAVDRETGGAPGGAGLESFDRTQMTSEQAQQRVALAQRALARAEAREKKALGDLVGSMTPTGTQARRDQANRDLAQVDLIRQRARRVLNQFDKLPYR